MTIKNFDYQSAGVNIDIGNELVNDIKKDIKTTYRKEIIGDIGGFGGLCRIPEKYQKPILVSCTDGVGTKLKLAIDHNLHQHVGIDLVAMCVNDLIVQGAEPLFFLDYYATGKLDKQHATTIIRSIAEGCRQAHCSLIGGETAEMPDMYHNSDYDLAGFSVGIVEEDKIITGHDIQVGDTLIALSSSGFHSNGFSLIRKIIDTLSINVMNKIQGKTIIEQLMIPTKIYVDAILALQEQVNIHGISHITGDGILENIPRILPQNCCAHINTTSWVLPEIFQFFQNEGNIAPFEMYRTFNCGIGLVLIIPKEDVNHTLSLLSQYNETAWIIGEIKEKSEDQLPIILH